MFLKKGGIQKYSNIYLFLFYKIIMAEFGTKAAVDLF